MGQRPQLRRTAQQRLRDLAVRGRLASGDLAPLHADGSAWVSFDNVEKQTTTGPAGPHMMLFDPSIPLEDGEH